MMFRAVVDKLARPQEAADDDTRGGTAARM
jgi:hypothetical protein